MKPTSKAQQFSFQSKLERISDKAEYFAISVPAKISEALKTKGPVPVTAKVNGSLPFIVSLFPVGGGRHYIRVKESVRSEVEITGGDRVKVQITVRNRTDEVTIPKDLSRALKAEDVLEDFKLLPIGKRSHLIRYIEEASRPETREKRVQAALEVAHEKREKRMSGKKKS